MSMTQKLRRSLSLFFVAILFSTVLFSVAAPRIAKADGQGGSSISEQLSGNVLDHQLYFFLKRCFIEVNIDEIDDDEIDDWRWFEGDEEERARGAMYANYSVQCDEGSFIKEAFGRFGFTNSLDTFCSLDFAYNRSTGGPGEGGKAEACKAGYGDDEFDASGSTSGQAKALDKLLAKSPKFNKAKGALSPAEEYVRYYRTLMNACAIKLDKKYTTGAASNEPYLYKVVVVNQDGTTEDWLGVGSSTTWENPSGGSVKDRGRDSTKHVLVDTLSGSPQYRTCGQLAQRTAELASAYAGYVKSSAGQNDSFTTASSESSESQNSCESEGGLLSWILCPVLNILDGVIYFLASAIEALLNVDEATYRDPSVEKAWAAFRNLAFIILIPMMMLMVIGTALSFGPFDAYTVKKALPRMLFAVVFIALSLPITQFFVEFSNVAGQGISGLVLSAGDSPGSLTEMYSLAGGALFSGMVLIGGTAGILLAGAATLGTLGSLALVTVVALLIGFVILIVRELLITVLIILAPVAILVWIFPGNDKLWIIWRGTFTALLMMFPFVMILIASGKVFAGVIDDTESDLVAFFTKIIAFILPFFFIPATFKFGLGVFGNIAGMVNDRSRGFFDQQRKFRAGSRANARHKAASGNRFVGGNDSNFRGKLNRGIASTVNAPGAILSSGNTFKASNWAGATRTAQSGRNAAEIERNMKENQLYQTWSGDDELNRAASESHDEATLRAALARSDSRAVANGGQARFGSPAAMDDAVARVQGVRRGMGTDAFRQMTTMQALAGGTAYDTAGEAWEAVARAGQNDDAATATMVAKGRNALMGVGRVDQGGAGFGDTMGSVQSMQEELRRTGTVSAATLDGVTQKINQGAIDSASPQQVLYGKPSSARNLAAAHTSRINNLIAAAGDATSGVAAGTHTQAQADLAVDEVKQAMASAAGVYDAMASASPQNARAFANGLTGAGIVSASLPPALQAAFNPTGGSTAGSGSVSMLEAMDNLRATDPVFSSMRKDWQTNTAAGAAAAAAAGSVPPPPAAGGGPPGGLPSGPPKGP